MILAALAVLTLPTCGVAHGGGCRKSSLSGGVLPHG